jgi:predicted O-linked N-acetylglucosamine transferase (SPINDLY family)
MARVDKKYTGKTAAGNKKRKPEEGKPSESKLVESKAIASRNKVEHPLLTQAKLLLNQGNSSEAVKLLLELADKSPAFERAQLLAQASQVTRVFDKKKAKELADQAIEADPRVSLGWMALSMVLDELRKHKEAVDAAIKALDGTANNSAKELVDIGRHLSRLGEGRRSLEAVKKGWHLSKGAIELATYVLRVGLQTADWDLVEEITKKLYTLHISGKSKQVGETPRTHLLWCDDEAVNVNVLSLFAERQFPTRTPLILKAWPNGDKRKIRIGYLSSDYRDHATSLLALGLMRHHNKDRFEFYTYCTSYDDGSAIRREMLNRCKKAYSFSNSTAARAAKQIIDDKIDILVDLNGLTEGTRHDILALRPAPVQISYLGFPGTVGGRFIDYIIADSYTLPPGQENLYREKIIRIPPTYQINDYRARYLPPAPSRRKLGLPLNKPIIGMFNNVNKVGREVWETWMQILKSAPDAILWMIDPGEIARENLLKAAESQGVDIARIIFAPKLTQEAHIARLQQCDLILDPWPYGGHTTTGDAIFAGIPVIALEGKNFASRVSGGLLIAAGLAHLVAKDKNTYIKIALSLLNNPIEIKKMKMFIASNKHRLPIFDAPSRTKQIETAYLEAYKLSSQGIAPKNILVRPIETGKSSKV